MKYSNLKIIAQYLNNFKTITSAKRVEDTIVQIIFDGEETLFFDMRKGDAYIFKKDTFDRAKVYNAPFDVVLAKRLGRSKIEGIEVLQNNRILSITVNSSSSYKVQQSILQLEFTGKNTNFIILDESYIVLEALRHIDSGVSTRSVKVGEKLKTLPPFEIREKAEHIDDLDKFLREEYAQRTSLKLDTLKLQKIKNIQKRIDKLQNVLKSLDSEEKLLEKAEIYGFWGTLILSNMDKVKTYQTDITLHDFEGNKVDIILPKEARDASEAADLLFTGSKRLKKKAKSLHIEKENLQEKIEFFIKMQNVIHGADDETKVNILYPKQKQQKKAKQKQVSYESFYMEGYKIMLGKNEKGNIELLKEAKKRDIWFHLKDIPSSHVIIRTDKQNIPRNVLEFAAKLCVDFSVDKKGSYLVDYTQRRNVKITEGAHVQYVDYQTISIPKD